VAGARERPPQISRSAVGKEKPTVGKWMMTRREKIQEENTPFVD